MSIELNKRAEIINEIVLEQLRDGEMPTSSDIMSALTGDDIIARVAGPAREPARALEGAVARNDEMNELIKEIELDTAAMRATLDEAWLALKTTVEKAMRVMPVVQREAEILSGAATRALALTPMADGVSVGQDPISISTGIGFGSIDGADMALSSGVEVDLSAGALILERTSSAIIPASASKENWLVTGEYNTRVDTKIGDPTWTCDGDIAKSWTVAVSTQSEYGRVSLETIYDLGEAQLPLKRVEVLIPNFTETIVDVAVDHDGRGNFKPWESASGKGRIVVDGASAHAKRVKVTFRRHKADSFYFFGATPRHEYLFQIAEVIFSAAAYVEEGNIITDAIQMGYDQVMSTIVDVDAITPSTSSVNVYIARDIDSPASLNDFRWVPVDKASSSVNLMTVSRESMFITAQAPSKVLTGAGVYMNSLYDIGETEGQVLSIDEGFEQLLFQKQSVVPDDDGGLPAVTAVGWSTIPSTVISRTGATLSGGNYYKLSTSAWVDEPVSHQLDITLDGIPAAGSYVVLFNSVDVTERLKAGQRSVGFVSGRNDIVILVSSGPTTAPITFSMGAIPTGTMAIERPTIVQEMSLISSEPRFAQSGKDLLVNHDPTGRVFRLLVKKATGSSIDAVRIRIELKRGLNGETPQVKSVYMTTGV